MAKPTFKKGDKVFAKVKGYPPWPAAIVEDIGKRKYSVIFYGTKETGTIKVEDLCYYLQNRDNYAPKYLKRAGYEEAVNEIDAAVKQDGGDGSENSTYSPLKHDSVQDVSDSSTDGSITEKKAIKRKANSLPDEPAAKKSVGRPRRKSIAIDLKDDGPIENQHEKEPRKKLAHVDYKVSLAETIIKEQKEEDNSPKEPEFVSIEDNTDSTLQPEEITLATASKFDVVTERLLKNNVLYGKYVRDHESIYKGKAVETREDGKNTVFPVKLPLGPVCGLKIHREWPLKFSDEYDRALYDEKVGTELLELKKKLITGNKIAVDEEQDLIILDINMTVDDIKEISYKRDIEAKQSRLERLKIEASLVSLDSKIKDSLGLDKADPTLALEHLKEFDTVDFDPLMLKKHPHIMDTVRRLRKYVGNVKEWNMTDKELEEFMAKAAKIRTEAEKLYDKIKSLFALPDSKIPFWDAFLEILTDFRNHCKSLTDEQISLLCAEPNSRKAFFDRLDDASELQKTVEISDI
ncbi:PC4 and SFRS1-interacting protein isoform X2 [Cylas formicarius]|uniref:PC4 and SFRS1-interacting protein isoform X2 n=1 Tax=Cylas formicarius TaxID=197179 RepID=UPI00295883FA|nr:PC4 and SFRS1-interacting protein isoform X2 [Cylas formicarius]